MIESVLMTRRLGVVLAVCAFAATASADQAKPKKAPAPAAKKEKAPEAPPADAPPADGSDSIGSAGDIEAKLPPHINGPQLVDLGHDTEINLPAGMILFEHAEAKKILEQSGDHADNVNAIIVKLGADWMVVVEYEDVGYVTDTDADQLDANELFSQYQEGTRQQNERRRTLGVPELFLDGWSQMPQSDKAKHHLVWGLKAHTDGPEGGPVINFFTRILGRHGYMSVDLIDSPDTLEASKVETAGLMIGTRFKTGFTYEDHQEGDKSSGMGLRALVVGGTGLAVMKAAKTGILIKLLLVFKKGFIFIILGIAGLFKWIFSRKKDENLAVSDDQAPPSDPSTNG